MFFRFIVLSLGLLTTSYAFAAPQVLQEIPASLLGDASRQNVFVLAGDADEASNRLLIAPVQARNEDILLDTSKALPLIRVSTRLRFRVSSASMYSKVALAS